MPTLTTYGDSTDFIHEGKSYRVESITVRNHLNRIYVKTMTGNAVRISGDDLIFDGMEYLDHYELRLFCQAVELVHEPSRINGAGSYQPARWRVR